VTKESNTQPLLNSLNSLTDYRQLITMSPVAAAATMTGVKDKDVASLADRHTTDITLDCYIMHIVCTCFCLLVARVVNFLKIC